MPYGNNNGNISRWLCGLGKIYPQNLLCQILGLPTNTLSPNFTEKIRGLRLKGILPVSAYTSQNILLLDYINGRVLEPMRYLSMECAARRPSEIAQTIKDWPRLMSPAEKIPFSEVI